MADPFAVPAVRSPCRLPLVNAIRAEVDAWRAGGYRAGTSATSRRLLEHWFLDQHQRPDGTPFAWYFAQREAVETLVYLHEVAGIRSTDALLARFATGPVAASPSPFARYVVKMATGAGKTKVMSLAIAWSYFHRLYEPGSPLATNSLLVAPNLIVFERLRSDFQDARIFSDDPIVPPEFRSDLDLQVVLRDGPAPFTATGVLCLTNVQLLYERKPAEPRNPVDALLGPRPPADPFAGPPLLERLAERGRVLVVNDEAHHLHDQVKSETGEPLVALRSIARLHELCEEGVVAQLDLSATPRNADGRPFPEIVSDYPLGAAIDDGIVKRPIIGELTGDLETPSDDASIRYRMRLDAGVAKWREFRDRFAPAGRKPLLFVMAEDTRSADQIADYLGLLPDLAGRVLTIHVNMSGAGKGEIKKSELEDARRWAREVDQDDNPYAAIVSVLMLREGWDVRNVSVIVPLRPYTAKSQILPEQTLGRGLRRMTPPGSGVEERVVVIEHEAFRKLWDDELAEEGLDIDRAAPDDIEVPAEVIAVDPARVPELDIAIPQLGRRLVRSAARVDDLDVGTLPPAELRLPEHAGEAAVTYTGRDLRSGEVVERGTYDIATIDDPAHVLAWYTERLQHESRLTGQFAALFPVVRDYVRDRAFGGTVDLEDPRVARALAEPLAREVILSILRRAVDEATLVQGGGTLGDAVSAVPLSATRPFLWSGEVASATRSIFPRQPCDSGLEVRMVGFLDRSDDVAAFAKLAPASRVSMEYRNDDGRMAFYYPDFAVRLVDGDHWLVETKGQVDLDVPAKDRRAAQWAVDATMVTGVTWSFVRLDEDLFDEHALGVRRFDDLVQLARGRERARRLAATSSQGRRSKAELLDLMDRVSQRSHDEPPDVDAEIRRWREGDR